MDFKLESTDNISIIFTPYISVFSPNTGKYGPEKNPYLDSFHAVFFAEHYMQISILQSLNVNILSR